MEELEDERAGCNPFLYNYYLLFVSLSASPIMKYQQRIHESTANNISAFFANRNSEYKKKNILINKKNKKEY